MRNYSVEEILSTSWERKIALDLLAEFEACTGEKRSSTEEMRRFLACKAYRELLERLQRAKVGKRSHEAVRAVAQAMRDFALERPALASWAFRTPSSECPEWREAHTELCHFLMVLFAEFGLNGRRAELATCSLRCLVRGYVVHEVMGSFLATYPYAEAFDDAIEVFITGISARSARDMAARGARNEYQWT